MKSQGTILPTRPKVAKICKRRVDPSCFFRMMKRTTAKSNELDGSQSIQIGVEKLRINQLKTPDEGDGNLKYEHLAGEITGSTCSGIYLVEY